MSRKQREWLSCDFNYSWRARVRFRRGAIKGEGRGIGILNRPLRSARCQLRFDRPAARSRAVAFSIYFGVPTTYRRPRRLHPRSIYGRAREQEPARENEEREPTRISFRSEVHSVSSGSRPCPPRSFPGEFKNVRHLDGSHAPSLGAVKVDLKGCTAVAGPGAQPGTRREM